MPRAQSSRTKNYSKSEEASIAKELAANDPKQRKIKMKREKDGRVRPSIASQEEPSLTAGQPDVDLVDLSQTNATVTSTATSQALMLSSKEARKLFTKHPTEPDYCCCFFCPSKRK